ncbi:MAG: aspartyl protease family protein [Saprospiraceae bacterium]|nr:aspartyl protease family protein [Saprospiraceae bacterium]
MKKVNSWLLPLIVLFQLGCTMQLSNAFQQGSLQSNEFREIIHFENKIGLIILPVKLKGKTYNFLFDTGAPLSISKELQAMISYKKITSGHIVDSDKNRKKVNYVQVDSLFLGNIPFINQTAFVGDFQSNPVIKCLNIDGIIGSNLMRHCNWTIDFQNQELTFGNYPTSDLTKESIHVPFKKDMQYDLLIDIKKGNTVIKNVKIDFGSNGSLQLPSAIFNDLKKQGLIEKTNINKGFRQGGIIGNPVEFTQEITLIDDIQSGQLTLNDIELKSGFSKLIGTEILSNYRVTIDWTNKNLVFQKIPGAKQDHSTFGFRIGYSKENLYIQSVTEGSSAYQQGLRTNMVVTNLNSLDFYNGADFCDYIDFLDKKPKDIEVKVIDRDRMEKTFFITKGVLQ